MTSILDTGVNARELTELDALFDELQLYPTVLNDAVTDTHLETSAATTTEAAAAVNAAGPNAQLRYLAQQWGTAEVATHLRDLAALEAT